MTDHDDDDDDVLLALALARHEPRDDLVVARAKRIVRAPGGLARAYRVLDDAGAVLAAHGLRDDVLLAETPLARLLEEEARAGSPRGLVAFAPRIAPWLAAAAAAFAFAVVRHPPETAALFVPHTKGVGASLQAAPAVVVSVLDVRGPLGADGVIRGLEPQAEALGRCSDPRAVIDVRFRVRGDGLVEGAVASSPDRAVAACVGGVVERTAFAFHDDATDVEATVELHPSEGSP